VPCDPPGVDPTGGGTMHIRSSLADAYPTLLFPSSTLTTSRIRNDRDYLGTSNDLETKEPQSAIVERARIGLAWGSRDAWSDRAPNWRQVRSRRP